MKKNNLYYELLGRINELEARVKDLEVKENNRTEVKDTVSNIKENKISKNEMIADIRDILASRLNAKNVFARKAIPKNGEGSGIIIENEDTGDKKKILVKKSKDYSEEANIDDKFEFSGWFTSIESELREYDGYIFVVYKHSLPTYFVFDKQDMKSILESKTRDSNNKYHFYLAEDKNGQYFDHRDNQMSLTQNVDAWKKIEEIIMN
ncbi:TPA: hypothetical protein ACONOZ_002661 [Staphylococcus aureus]